VVWAECDAAGSEEHCRHPFSVFDHLLVSVFFCSFPSFLLYLSPFTLYLYDSFLEAIN